MSPRPVGDREEWLRQYGDHAPAPRVAVSPRCCPGGGRRRGFANAHRARLGALPASPGLDLGDTPLDGPDLRRQRRRGEGIGRQRVQVAPDGADQVTPRGDRAGFGPSGLTASARRIVSPLTETLVLGSPDPPGPRLGRACPSWGLGPGACPCRSSRRRSGVDALSRRPITKSRPGSRNRFREATVVAPSLSRSCVTIGWPSLGWSRAVWPLPRRVATGRFDPLARDRMGVVEGEEAGFRPHAPCWLLQLVRAVRVLWVAHGEVVLPDRRVRPPLLVAGQPEVPVVQDLDLPAAVLLDVLVLVKPRLPTLEGPRRVGVRSHPVHPHLHERPETSPR